MTRPKSARALAPDLLSSIRITAALLDERERKAARTAKAAGVTAKQRAVQARVEVEDSKLRYRIWRQLRMTAALLEARVRAEEMQIAGIAKYFRAMVALSEVLSPSPLPTQDTGT